MTLAAFPYWMAILRHWNRNWVDRGLPVAVAMRRPVPRKNVAASFPEPLMSPLQAEQNSTDRTTLCISLVCGPRRQRRLCRQQLTLDAGGLWPECLDMWTCEVPHRAPAVWPWHQCQAIWTLAIIPRQTRRLQSGGNLRSSERALYETIDGAVSRMTVTTVRPADRRHDRPWTPYWSTFSPQTHWWGAQIGAPRRSTVAMRNDELSRRVPANRWAWDCVQKISRMRWCNRKKPGSTDCGDWWLCSWQPDITYSRCQ